MERLDTVVVGGGLGGLAAGVALAGEGRSVVVLEQHTLPGGYAQSFQRGPYRFDTALHALNGLAAGGGADAVYRELGIRDRVRLHRLDPLYRLRVPGLEVDAHADLYRYESELIGHFPEQAEGLRAYLDEVRAIYRDGRRLEEDTAAGRLPVLEQMAARYPAMVRVVGETWEQVMSRHVGDARARARAMLGALWGYVGLPPSQCSALVGAGLTGSYHEHGGWYPEGSAQVLSDALVQVLQERGGEIRYGQLVTGLEVEGDRVVAVTTATGKRLQARAARRPVTPSRSWARSPAGTARTPGAPGVTSRTTTSGRATWRPRSGSRTCSCAAPTRRCPGSRGPSGSARRPRR